MSFAFNKTKSQKQCFIWDDIRERHAFSTIFLHRVGSSWVTPDDPSKQWFSALSKSGWFGPTPDDLDLDRSDRSGWPVWPVWLRAIYLHIPKWEMMLWIIIWRTLSLKGPEWIHKSDSKYCKHNFNYWILFVCLTKFVSKLAMFLIEPSALQSRYSKS